MSAGLDALAREIAAGHARLNYPPANWVFPRHDENGAPIADVVIVGAGMCGLAAAYALKRNGIANIRVLDARPAEHAAQHAGAHAPGGRMAPVRPPYAVGGGGRAPAPLRRRA